MAERQIAQRHIKDEPKVENVGLKTILEPEKLPVDVNNIEIQNDSTEKFDELEYLDNTSAKDLPFRDESEDEVERLTKYISQQVEYFNNKITFAAASINPPTPYEIEMAFSTWVQTSFSLNSMYEFTQNDADNAEAELKHFINIKKSELRSHFNTINAKKAAWLSATEIEAAVYSKYRNDIAKLETKVIELRREASYLNSMKKTWSDYLWVLKSLKDMSLAEMSGMKFTPDLRRGDETDLM